VFSIILHNQMKEILSWRKVSEEKSLHILNKRAKNINIPLFLCGDFFVSLL